MKAGNKNSFLWTFAGKFSKTCAKYWH